MILFLVGFMGCGKSTIGRRLAERLGWSFVDTDELVVEKASMEVAEIFERFGDSGFRKLESEVLGELPQHENMIVATGGGLPCFNNNMEQLLQKGKVAYFRMTPENLVQRLLVARIKRPKIASMKEPEMLQYITHTLAEREQYYSQAHVVIDCNGVDYEYIIGHLKMIIDTLR